MKISEKSFANWSRRRKTESSSRSFETGAGQNLSRSGRLVASGGCLSSRMVISMPGQRSQQAACGQADGNAWKGNHESIWEYSNRVVTCHRINLWIVFSTCPANRYPTSDNVGPGFQSGNRVIMAANQCDIERFCIFDSERRNQ